MTGGLAWIGCPVGLYVRWLNDYADRGGAPTERRGHPFAEAGFVVAARDHATPGGRRVPKGAIRHEDDDPETALLLLPGGALDAPGVAVFDLPVFTDMVFDAKAPAPVADAFRMRRRGELWERDDSGPRA